MKHMKRMQGLCALRGTLLYAPAPGELRCMERGVIVTEDGVVRSVAPVLPEKYAAAAMADYGDALILPGFCDMHLHAPQYPMLGLGMDLPLLQWLSAYTYPLEARFADEGYARRIYAALGKALIAGGTTRVSVFSSLHRPATRILMEELESAGVTGFVGKVNMDRNGGAQLQETTEESIRETEAWLADCAFEHVFPILTPRFTPSCTDGLMAALGRLARERNLPVQSHLSETPAEIAWVKELTGCDYPQSYARFGLFQEKTLMAHCVHSDAAERARIKAAGVSVVHCPDSNTNIASGICPVRKMLREGLKVCLGSDIAGGAKLRMCDVATEAIRVSKLRYYYAGKAEEEAFLTVREAFYLMTTGGQEFFGAAPGFGENEPLHAVVLDDSAFAENPGLSPEERLERALYLSGNEHIAAVYSAGRRVK